MDENLVIQFSAKEASIINHISYYANKEWGFCSKSYATIARELDCSRKTVYRAVKKAKQLGLVTLEGKGRNPSHKKTAVLFDENKNDHTNDHTKRPYYIKKLINIAARAPVDNLHSEQEETKIPTICQLDGLDLSHIDKSCVKRHLSAHAIKPERLEAAVRRYRDITAKTKVNNKGGLLIALLKDMGDEQMFGLTPEVSAIIDKKFFGQDKIEVESALRHFDAVPALKVLVAETLASRREWMRNKGERIENIGAFCNSLAKSLRDNYYNKHDGKPVNTEKKDYYGVPVSDIQKLARPGETYEQAALRIKGVDVKEAAIYGVSLSDINRLANPGESKEAAAIRILNQRKGNKPKSGGATRWAGMEIHDEVPSKQTSSAELEARRHIKEYMSKFKESQLNKGMGS